jgi:branched-chain amino acid transport system permease protein
LWWWVAVVGDGGDEWWWWWLLVVVVLDGGGGSRWWWVAIVVVVGGLGSIGGAIAASVVYGFIQVIGNIVSPLMAVMTPYVMLFFVLLWRPQGFGRGRVA